jgi:hypothetical protein
LVDIVGTVSHNCLNLLFIMLRLGLTLNKLKKNVQFRDTENIGHTGNRTKTNKIGNKAKK